MNNERYTNIITKILLDNKLEGSAIKNIELLTVEGQKVEVRVSKKAGKLLNHMMSDMDLLLNSTLVESYDFKMVSDMVVVFNIVLKK